MKNEYILQTQIIGYLKINNIPYITSLSKELGWALGVLSRYNKQMSNIISNTAKKVGWAKGISDMIICKGNDKYHGIILELKTDKNKLSTSQEAYFENFIKHGYKKAVVYDFEDFLQLIT